MNNNKIIEKQIKKYVIATINGKYLRRDVMKNDYSFVEDIEIASKAINYETAQDVLKYFYHDTGLNSVKLVIIPVEITYELINETN